MNALQAAHHRNEERLSHLENEVMRATSPPSVTKTPGTSANSDKHSGRPSPASLAAALFNRSKGKSKSSSSSSKSKSKSTASTSASTSHSASIAHLNELEREIQAIEDNESALVSSAIGFSQDGQEIAPGGDDEVLDRADRLIAQLERAKSNEQAQLAAQSSQIPTVARGIATADNVPLAQPTPLSAATTFDDDSRLRVPSTSGRSISGSSISSYDSGGHSSGHAGLGAKLKKVFSPDHSGSQSRSSSSHDAKIEAFAHKHPFPGDSQHTTSQVSPALSSSDKSSSSSGVATPSAVLAGVPPRGQPPQKNRHQLRKERKAAQDDALRAQAQAEVDAERTSGKQDPAEAEKAFIDRTCASMGLEMVEMNPDGHCMFSAVADQMNVQGRLENANYATTRKAAAGYMRKHMDDFLPYLPAEDEEGQGEGLLSPEGYAKHCNDVESTSVWGSETELLALSKYFKVPIYVVQANCPVVKHGAEEQYGSQKPLVVSYHRAMYGLGEHYNSLRPKGCNLPIPSCPPPSGPHNSTHQKREEPVRLHKTAPHWAQTFMAMPA